jgi:transcriptional regulator GlxA family with amidase domain
VRFSIHVALAVRCPQILGDAASSDVTGILMLNVALCAFEGVDLLDIAGPLQVFSYASDLGRGTDPKYCVSVISMSGMGIRTSSGLLISTALAQQALADGIDTLLVAGGAGAAKAANDKALLHWLQANRALFRRIGATSSGAFVLAAAGILDGRRATTHWANISDLQRGHPAVQVDQNALFVQDGDVWTSAGVTAGIDMALAMVEADAGRGLAMKTAKNLVLYLKRSSGEAQISTHLHAQHMSDDLRMLLERILENPREEYSVPQLVEISGMSMRSLYRAFYQQLKTTPREFVEMARLEVAKRLLEENGVRPGRVAEQAGFGSREAMRRSFQKRLGTSPTAYRQKHHSAERRSA